MIIVINKETLDCQPYSTLIGACKDYEFEKTLYTLQKENFPIWLDEFVIHKKEEIKTKYKSTTF
jgi:hypothetical protein